MVYFIRNHANSGIPICILNFYLVLSWVRYHFWALTWNFDPFKTIDFFHIFMTQNEIICLTKPNVKRKSVTILQILFGVNLIIYKGVMAPQSEVTHFH